MSSEFPTLRQGDAPAIWAKRAQWWLAGKNRHRRNFRPGAIDGSFGPMTQRACERAKWVLGYPTDRIAPSYGQTLHSYMIPLDDPRAAKLPLSYQARKRLRRLRKNPYREELFVDKRPWPFLDRETGRLIGCPYQGTHTLGNWESDNAVDLLVPVGTPVVAIWDGQIGTRIGSLDTSNPRLLGLRLHLVNDHGRDSYYAHLSSLRVNANQRVRKGDILGLSGSANGVPHLHIGVEPPGRPDDLFAIGGC